MVRFYVDATAGAETPLGAFKLVACFDSPDATPEGPYFLEFELDILSAVFKAPSMAGTYTWRTLVTPYVDGTTNPDPSKTFEARARVLVPHLLTERARYLSRSRQLVVTGRLLARGQPRRRVSVWLAAGPHKGALRLVGRVRTRADGRYSFRMPVREGRRPRVVDVVVFRIESPGLCVAPSTAPAGCVDERVSPPAPHLVQVRIPKLPKRR